MSDDATQFEAQVGQYGMSIYTMDKQNMADLIQTMSLGAAAGIVDAEMNELATVMDLGVRRLVALAKEGEIPPCVMCARPHGSLEDVMAVAIASPSVWTPPKVPLLVGPICKVCAARPLWRQEARKLIAEGCGFADPATIPLPNVPDVGHA